MLRLAGSRLSQQHRGLLAAAARPLVQSTLAPSAHSIPPSQSACSGSTVGKGLSDAPPRLFSRPITTSASPAASASPTSPSSSSAGKLPQSNAAVGAGITAASKFDAVIVGGGHNGLVSAAYLAKAGMKVLVLERRHVLGGAAITEEIVPGFKFSRASYLLSLLRPVVIEDLKLKQHGLKVHMRNPSSFSPLRDGRYLLMGSDHKLNHEQISKFSAKDAEAYPKYEQALDRMATAIDPLLDSIPFSGRSSLSSWSQVQALAKTAVGLLPHMQEFYQILTAPASKILDRWFESEPLKTTLATDAVIGAMVSPHTPGSGYVLFHHVMGGVEGVRGAWGYAEGGMGGVSSAIASAARAAGVTLQTNATVSSIVVDESANRVKGVKLQDGTMIEAKYVLSNATPKVTFLDLIKRSALPDAFVRDVSTIDYASPVTKINVAISELPNFTALPNKGKNVAGPHHQTTIHLGCETIQEIDEAFVDAKYRGKASEMPVIEMCLPSVLDKTLAPEGKHVVSLFTQYTPYKLAKGDWDVPGTREAYAEKIFTLIDSYAPGFKASVLGYDILTPMDLERVFGLTGGNIFHGAMALDQLYFVRPTRQSASHKTPIQGLFLCGSGAHPGGGVMGAAGRNCANALLASAGR
ncbi:Pyridine nucleotide-disulfide oxidoreductase domain-containing protein [Capsaspora owczarzaki ATCC 30864]|nr:Pyridine nucleotide-disulfide oxidoreductase domain-containing protein [Capsaspora owczarzaki ATCC 30864]|eukprot:XP_004346387.2 Pyridine nucleotide-disulfide oxidoreductase domain-containing protein [Capsaspora owczarzaki ATCC 30864]